MVIEAAARSRIDRFLGRVEAHLVDRSEEDRDELLRDLESHIHDALAGRSEALLADVEAVIAEMDPPESYGTLVRPVIPPPASAGRPMEVKLAIGLVIAGIAGLLLVSVLYELVHEPGPYGHRKTGTGWILFWTCQLAAGGCGLWAALRKVGPVPAADRGPEYAKLSLFLLVGSVVLFTGIWMLVDGPGGEIVPLLFVAATVCLLGAHGFGRASHGEQQQPVRGSLQPLGRMAPTLMSLAATLTLIGVPLEFLRQIARQDRVFKRDYDLFEAWPEPLAWVGYTLLIFAVETGLLALLGRLTTIGVKGLLWPLLNRGEGSGNRGFAVTAAAFAVLAAVFLAAYALWPEATPA